VYRSARPLGVLSDPAAQDAPTWGQNPGPWRPFRDRASVWLNAECLPYDFDAEMPVTFFTDEAVRFIAEKRRKPFFLCVGFFVTHAPFRFPIEYCGLFDPVDVPVPEIGPEDGDQIPLAFRDLTNWEKRGIIAAYYTSPAYMDRNLV
jgi:choline-sulfatase